MGLDGPCGPDKGRHSEEGSKRTPGGWDRVMLPQSLGLPDCQVRCTRAASHLPRARFMPPSAALRGSADPLPPRRRFCFKRQSASSAAAAEPEEDESEAAQRSCSKVTGSVRFLIPRPSRPAVHGVLASPARLSRSRRRSKPSPPGAGSPLPLTSQPQAAAPAMDKRRRPVGHRGQSARGAGQPPPQARPHHLRSCSAGPASPAPAAAILEKGGRS